MITAELANHLPDDPVEAIHKICKEFAIDPPRSTGGSKPDYSYCLESLAFLKAYTKSKGIELRNLPTISGALSDRTEIMEYFSSLGADASKQITLSKYEQIQSRYNALFGQEFCYELSDGDLKQIQTRITELRELLVSTKELEDDHRQRLINKLEALQKELHKKMSNLDRFWGILIEGAVVMAKVGETSKPIVDRIREIAEIVWRAQARAEELPSSTTIPLLPETKEKS